jgi:pyruvate formate lyase activating enzyme
MEYPIKGFIETSFSDWPGKVVAVLFLPSCNFRCPYCHNHGLVLHPEQFPNVPLAEIRSEIRKRRGWIDGICISGGEPTLHPWLPDLIAQLRSDPSLTPSGGPLPVKIDTNGSRPAVLRGLIEAGLLDAVAMDLKGPLEKERYSAIAGVTLKEEDLAAIRTSIDLLLWGTIDSEFRTTVVPSLLSEEEIYRMAQTLQGARRYTLQNFSPRDPLDPTLRQLAPMEAKDLKRMQERVNEVIRIGRA